MAWLTNNNGAMRLANEAKNNPLIIASDVICPPIHNMVVVTSPIGDQAPPALAEITTIAANRSRSSCFCNSFLVSEIITIVAVKLSRTALKKKDRNPTIHNKCESFLVLIRDVITSKPLCASMTSTMVIAPIKKKTISAVEAIDSLN